MNIGHDEQPVAQGGTSISVGQPLIESGFMFIPDTGGMEVPVVPSVVLSKYDAASIYFELSAIRAELAVIRTGLSLIPAAVESRFWYNRLWNWIRSLFNPSRED